MTKRKTYEKYEQINKMFDALENQIVHAGDLSHFRKNLYFVNHEHRENYEALIVYYSQAENDPVVSPSLIKDSLISEGDNFAPPNNIFSKLYGWSKFDSINHCKV